MCVLVAPKFTAEFRDAELKRGERSLFYFGVSILGFDAWDKKRKRSILRPWHRDLCHFLEGRAPHYPWNEALVCAFRGAGKSMWTTKAYPWWRGLYIPDFSCKILGNSFDNVKLNHFGPMIDLFTSSRRADYLQWLFQDRIPSGFSGWTSEQIKLIQEEATALPFLTYQGLDSKLESYHGDLIVLDDPEGADAEKSRVGNEESKKAYENSHPLLISQNQGQILISATPHGSNPLVYWLRDRENWTGPADNARSHVKIWWLPVVDSSGNSQWPEKISSASLERLRKLKNSRQQFWLERTASDVSIFDMPAILKHAFDWAEPRTKSSILYKGVKYDPDKLDDLGRVREEEEDVVVEMRRLRFFLHLDPLHRTPETRRSSPSKQRPAEAAIAVVGVNSDLHAMVVHTWADEKADLNAQLNELFRLYCLYAAHKATFESVGAQFWLKTLIENNEKSKPHWSRPISSDLIIGTRIPLPRLSTRLEEAEKTNETKDYLFRETLSPYINYGVLHVCREGQDKLKNQLENSTNEDVACDLVDCLTQGPKVWSAPQQDIAAREFARKRRSFVETFVRPVAGVFAKTGSRGRRWG